jgi:hypothetical protein
MTQDPGILTILMGSLLNEDPDNLAVLVASALRVCGRDGTYATPSQCQCAQTYTCACVLAGTTYSNQFGSFTVCGLASNGPPACSGGGDQPITLECP